MTKRCKTYCIILLGWFALQLATITVGLAANCADPVSPSLTVDRKNWQDMERLEATRSLNTLIEEVQLLRSRGHGAVNNDYYAITIEKRTSTAEGLLSDLRRNLSTAIFSGTTYRLEAIDAANAQRWASADPRGAVLSFTLAELPGVMPLERGSVVVSCTSPTNFVLSTVRTNRDGWHPVAGNRAFGVRDNGSTLTIWTKAADRIVSGGFFARLPESGREAIFRQGHEVWLRLIDNLAKQYADRSPRDRVVFSERRPYN